MNAGGGGQQARSRDPQRQLRPPAHLALPVPARDQYIYIYIPTHNRIHGAPRQQVQPDLRPAHVSFSRMHGSKRELRGRREAEWLV